MNGLFHKGLDLSFVVMSKDGGDPVHIVNIDGEVGYYLFSDANKERAIRVASSLMARIDPSASLNNVKEIDYSAVDDYNYDDDYEPYYAYHVYFDGSRNLEHGGLMADMSFESLDDNDYINSPRVRNLGLRVKIAGSIRNGSPKHRLWLARVIKDVLYAELEIDENRSEFHYHLVDADLSKFVIYF